MDLIKRVLKSIRYLVLYLLHYHKLESCGKHTVLIKPMRIMGGKNISIGDYTYILNGFRIEAIEKYEGQEFSPHIYIGDRVEMGQNCQISCVESIVIEDDVTLAPNVMINDSTHGHNDKVLPIERQPLSHAPIHIGKGSLIGYGAVILPGTTIGKNCFIGAGCIIAENIPDFTVVSNHTNMMMKTII